MQVILLSNSTFKLQKWHFITPNKKKCDSAIARSLEFRLQHFSECLRHWQSRGDIVISRTKTGNLQVKSPSGRTHVCVNEHRRTFDCKWKRERSDASESGAVNSEKCTIIANISYRWWRKRLLDSKWKPEIFNLNIRFRSKYRFSYIN